MFGFIEFGGINLKVQMLNLTVIYTKYNNLEIWILCIGTVFCIQSRLNDIPKIHSNRLQISFIFYNTYSWNITIRT